MIVTAAMCYFDDDLALLERSLSALPGFVDRLVVADGRYERYEPGGPPASPSHHHTFIRSTCRRLGLPVVVDVPDGPYAGQVQKRTRLMRLAADGSDWVAVVDSDHVFHGDPDAVRAELAATGADVMLARYFTPLNDDADIDKVAATQWHVSQAGTWSQFGIFMRAYPGYQVEHLHWCYSALVDNVRTWIYGTGPGGYPHGRVGQVTADFHMEHLCLFRQPRQVLANRAFCDDRELIVGQTGQEDWLVAA